MRKFLLLLGVMILVAATLRDLNSNEPVETTISVLRTMDGPDISQHVQLTVGHMLWSNRNKPPNLGLLAALRPVSGRRNVYLVQDTEPLHVYVIAQGPVPLLFTFEPGVFGHASSYQIILEPGSE